MWLFKFRQMIWRERAWVCMGHKTQKQALNVRRVSHLILVMGPRKTHTIWFWGQN